MIPSSGDHSGLGVYGIGDRDTMRHSHKNFTTRRTGLLLHLTFEHEKQNENTTHLCILWDVTVKLAWI